jgi:DUF971 family protein
MSAAHKIADADLNATGDALDVSWGDGHTSSYPLRLLRAECPCAQCKQDREDARTNPFHVLGAANPAAADLRDIEAVGNYGLRFTWRDGHQAGIFTFEYLREICPCADCKAARTDQSVPWVHGIYIPR